MARNDSKLPPRKKASSVKLSNKTNIASTWRDDAKVVKLQKRLNTFASEALKFFADSKETVMGVQRARVQAKRLTHRDVVSRGQDRLVDTIAQDKAHRSHIVEIQIDTMDRVQYMRDALSLARRDIKSRYAAVLKKEFGAITNQHDGIEDNFARAVKAVKAGELLLKLIDMIVNDIDKSQLSDKSLQKAADLVFNAARAD